MNTARIHVALLAVVQAIAFLAASLMGERWAILPAAASMILVASALWVPRSAFVEPHPAQRADSYRVAAQRAEETTVRVVKPKRRVLSCEYTEAKEDREGWGLAFFTVSLIAAIAGTALYAGVQWAFMPAVLLAIGGFVCLVGFVSCDRTVRTWRNQERDR